MTNGKVAALALIATLAAGGTTAALGHQDYSEPAGNHWLSHLQETTARLGERQQAPFGYAVSGGVDRAVTLAPGARYLNVTRQETVQISAGGKTVTWKFDTFGTPSFPLSTIVPGADGITVFVAEDPVVLGG